MADEVKQVDYYYVTVAHKPGEGARILTALRDAGVNLLGFCGFPQGARKAQLDFIPADPAAFVKAARQARIPLSGKKRAFLIQGDERPGIVSEVVSRLAEAGISVTSAQVFCAGFGRYGGVVWVKAADLRKAAKALAGFGARHAAPASKIPTREIVDESSDESFPASDPPSWNP
jgi:hypothetical protein